MKFNVYIDESGETGIAKVRSGGSGGASPYFVMGAVVCQPTEEVVARNVFSEFCQQIGRTSWKHATDLGHAEKVLFARELGRLPVRYFAVVSNKATLGDYKESIASDPHKFYNKCAQYLLEVICRYLGPSISDSDDLSVVFEERNHNYDAMRRLLIRVKETPVRPESKVLAKLNPFAITTKAKGTDEMLDIADFVSHAVFQCVNKSNANYQIPEPRYFREISSRFAGDKDGRIWGTGLKAIHSIDDLKLDPDIVKEISGCAAKKPSRS